VQITRPLPLSDDRLVADPTHILSINDWPLSRLRYRKLNPDRYSGAAGWIADPVAKPLGESPLVKL
jgi:hypothetical protein